MRKNGMLMPVSALPGAYGIGCFSREAYKFVDVLKEAGQKLWQILPLGQTGYHNIQTKGFSEKGIETFWILCFSFCFVYAKNSDFS